MYNVSNSTLTSYNQNFIEKDFEKVFGIGIGNNNFITPEGTENIKYIKRSEREIH